MVLQGQISKLSKNKGRIERVAWVCKRSGQSSGIIGRIVEAHHDIETIYDTYLWAG